MTVALTCWGPGVRNQSEQLSAFSRNRCPESSEYALAEGERVVTHLRSSSEARSELEDYGTPLDLS